jgi:hypothetical protein
MCNRRWLSSVAMVCLTVTCAGQTGPSRVDAPSAGALLGDSEIRYIESGGIAGRTYEARFGAKDARVTAQYGGPDLRLPDGGLQAGTVENDAYVKLWREADRLNLWTIESPRKAIGADLIECELTIRLGTRSQVIRWNDVSAGADRIRAVAVWAKRVMAVAREYAAYR